LRNHLWIFESSGDPFDVEPIQVPPPVKNFKIREKFDGSVSYTFYTVEAAGFEIQDEAGNSAHYIYKGAGLSLSSEKLPNWSPGASPPGPWNDFTAPGWLSVDDFEGDATMQMPYNTGVTTIPFGGTKSWTIFEFGGNSDGRRGFLVRLTDMQTANTYSLPSSGFTSGSMMLTTSLAKSAPQRRFRGGKFGGL
jgi:hypothetical protein